MMSVRDYIKRFYEAWLNKRLPLSSSIQLSQKRIFIFPNKIGWLFIAFLVLLFVTGTNYQNNLILSIAFIMVSVFITTIVASYQNLSALIIKTRACDGVYAGDSVSLPITFENPNKTAKAGLMLGFKNTSLQLIPIIKTEQRVTLQFAPQHRGWLQVPRIKVCSVYPLGLLTCWSWLRLEFNGIVYPKPIDYPFRNSLSEGEENQTQPVASGMDEFDGLRAYQKGDSLKRVAWRQYAKSQQLMTKNYLDYQTDERCLDWFALTGMETEKRLQVLAGWVVKCHQQQAEFSLKLPDLHISVASGDVHFKNCLKALALFRVGGVDGK